MRISGVYNSPSSRHEVWSGCERRRSSRLSGVAVTAAPLMLADFMAYTYSRMRASKASGGLNYDAEAPMAPRKREAGLTHLELLPEALRGLKEAFERERREAVDAWRARRDAQKAGSAG